MKRDIVIEVVYPHPPEKVWKALTDPNALAEWLMENDFEPRVGHKFQFRTEPKGGWSGIVDCEVLELDPPRRLSYSWKSEQLDTVVTFTLEPVAEGTRLRLEHTGFEGFKAILVSFILSKGWKKKILRQNLPEILAKLTT